MVRGAPCVSIMVTEVSQAPLSDEEIGLLVENKARKLRAGETSRDEFRDELVMVIAEDDDVIAREGPLRTNGRFTFGLKNEGAEGVGLFIVESDADSTE